MHDLRYGRQAAWLFQTAMLVFLVTIGLGMARGLGLIDFADRNQVLTHLHSGTIGWITLGIMGAVLVLYSRDDQRPGADTFLNWSCLVLVVTVPAYLVAWWTGNLPFRAIAGSALLLGIVMYVAWLVREAAAIGYSRLTTPQLGAVIGLVTLVVGSTLGVMLQIGFATATSLLPGDAIGAHAETQVSAYLVLVAMSLVYWGLHGNDRTARGTWMVWLFFAAGAILAVSFLAGADEGAVAFIPFDLAAIVILLTLVGGRVISPGWGDAAPGRHFAAAVPFALFYIGIFIFIIVGFLVFEIWPTFEDIPANFIPAAEHPLFVGVVTNILFAILLRLNRDKRHIWPWADDVLFWGLNAAVTVFTLALLFDVDALLPFVTPVLGLSILVGIIANSLRLQSSVGADRQPMPGT
ncbi:MAG TPA: hypothetical protein VK838_01310 [Candidatus Limnocylindrales bacterium]|nr:hypothetical protein [Candidatus Limnocylindrales bacterium]